MLKAIDSEGNLLSGSLSGTLPSDIYRITGDITVNSQDTLILEPGTQFLFDGEYGFIVEGVLKAQGTQQDSIIFDNYDSSSYWKGFTLYNQSQETIFEYVSILNAAKDNGGGIYMSNSDPVIKNSSIIGNESTGPDDWWEVGGGAFMLSSSDPVFENVLITNNSATCSAVGHMSNSNPTFINVTMAKNYRNSDEYCTRRTNDLYHQSSFLTIINSIYSDEDADPNATELLYEIDPTTG